MEENKNKVIAVSLIVILVIIAIIVAVMISGGKDKKQVSQQTNQQEQQEVKQQESSKDGTTSLTETEKEELNAIKVVTGTINSVNISKITVSTPEGEMELNVPQKGASFVKQTTQEDGSFLVEDIGLFDLPTDKAVEIQYNSNSNDVMLVSVK